jgi:hypothetical protein
LIENRAYRFVSPSFVKDHTHKDGRKIGTTLLAAAITNHPFLEGMSALTLYSFSAMGDLALVDTTTTAAPYIWPNWNSASVSTRPTRRRCPNCRQRSATRRTSSRACAAAS